jgi:glycerophosphoryl diester phosphodiesterase
VNKSKTLIIAHRGASAYAPENTIAAFQKAIDTKSDAFELDAKLTKDGEIVVIHDQSVDRTSNGKGKVKDLTLEEIQKLDAGSFFSNEFANEKIPTLREVLEKFSGQILINIELTNYSSIFDGLAEKTATLVKTLGVEKSVFFSSFHPLNLVITRKKLPDVQVALLAVPGKFGWLARSNLMRWVSPQIVHPYYKDIDEDYIDNQHKQKRKVNVWTINDEIEMDRFVKANIDGLITDDPILGRKVLERNDTN